MFIKTKDKFFNEVKDVRSFLDESYVATLSTKVTRHSDCQVPWARILIEKFCDRIIPHVSGENQHVEKAISTIMVAIKNAVSFGNGTVVVDSDGKVRASVPECSYAKMDAFGDVTFYEEHINVEDKKEILKVYGIDGILFYEWEDEDGNPILVETDSRFFSFFYHEDGSAPYGKSRISPAIRASIKEASRNKIRASEAANFRTFPQWVINGIWEGIDPSVADGVGKMLAGVSQVVGIPRNPDNGEKVSIEEFSSSDFSSYEAQHDILAKEVAAAGNLSPTELGVTAAQPSSAEALNAAKEDIVLEISAFERKIHWTLQALFDAISEVTGTDKVQLMWQEPSTPSKASQADAFVKIASVMPQMKYSKKALAWAGLPSDVIAEITEFSEMIVEEGE